jgi:TrmH family RNA methyltransferase
MITSASNPKVKLARALSERRGREQQGSCLVEGVRLIEDAMRAGSTPALIFFSAAARMNARTGELLDAGQAAHIPLWEVSAEVFATLSDTETSQGVIAVVPIPELPLPANPPLILILDQVRDPGNLGTILRSAAAAGAGCVLLAAGCADPWSPKALRAGMGAHFRLPLRPGINWAAIAAQVAHRPLWLADARGEVLYDQVDWARPCALVIGGETTGISTEARALGGISVAIPMAGEIESLNAAMAATVLLFEAAQQRRGIFSTCRGTALRLPAGECN